MQEGIKHKIDRAYHDPVAAFSFQLNDNYDKMWKNTSNFIGSNISTQPRSIFLFCKFMFLNCYWRIGNLHVINYKLMPRRNTAHSQRFALITPKILLWIRCHDPTWIGLIDDSYLFKRKKKLSWRSLATLITYQVINSQLPIFDWDMALIKYYKTSDSHFIASPIS